LLLHVGHFALERHWAHYRRCEDDGEVEWRHLRLVSAVLSHLFSSLDLRDSPLHAG
jgi:hypothetical protein